MYKSEPYLPPSPYDNTSGGFQRPGQRRLPRTPFNGPASGYPFYSPTVPSNSSFSNGSPGGYGKTTSSSSRKKTTSQTKDGHEKDKDGNYTWWGYLVKDKHQDVPEESLTNLHLLKGFVESSSSHGFPQIYRSTGRLKKLLWVLLTIGAFAGFGAQSYSIISSYFRYEKVNSITIETSRKLSFPAVTVCNLNLVRTSIIHSPEYTQLLKDISPSDDTSLDETDPDPELDENPDIDDPDQEMDQDQELDSDGEFDENSNLGKIDGDLEYTFKLMDGVARLSVEDKENLGHQMHDLIIDCVYNTFKCNISDFEWFYSPAFGNCYTFNGPNIKARYFYSTRSGPQNGLRLVLNVEQNEYLRSMNDAAGARVIVHPQGEFPFPEDNGLFVPPGYLTSIGLHRRTISRIATPISKCIDVAKADTSKLDIYQSEYPLTKYTVPGCERTCFQVALARNCNCTDRNIPVYGTALAGFGVDEAVFPCSNRNPTEMSCYHGVERAWKKNKIECNCEQPCTQSTYETESSIAYWPADNSLNDIVDDLSQKSDALYQLFKNSSSDPEQYRRNVVQVQVFYRELNFESISEKLSYERGQFLSDFGGCVGLWIGASLLTICEMFELIIDLIVLRAAKSSYRPREMRTYSGKYPYY